MKLREQFGILKMLMKCVFKLDSNEVSDDKGHLMSKHKSMTVPVLPFLAPSLIFLFPLLPSAVHPIGISFVIEQQHINQS